MKTSSKISIFGLVIALLGIAIYIYGVYLMPTYAGYSGGGMSGIPAALMILAALVMIALGILIATGSVIYSFMKSKQRPFKE